MVDRRLFIPDARLCETNMIICLPGLQAVCALGARYIFVSFPFDLIATV